jgi:hypothetical protein
MAAGFSCTGDNVAYVYKKENKNRGIGPGIMKSA